jgi:hypothetical protein
VLHDGLRIGYQDTINRQRGVHCPGVLEWHPVGGLKGNRTLSDIVYICESCGDFLTETEIVAEAAKLLPAGGGDVLEGHHVFFHPRHYPSASSRHRLVDRATTIDAALRRLGDR